MNYLYVSEQWVNNQKAFNRMLGKNPPVFHFPCGMVYGNFYLELINFISFIDLFEDAGLLTNSYLNKKQLINPDWIPTELCNDPLVQKLCEDVNSFYIAIPMKKLKVFESLMCNMLLDEEFLSMVLQESGIPTTIASPDIRLSLVFNIMSHPFRIPGMRSFKVGAI